MNTKYTPLEQAIIERALIAMEAQGGVLRSFAEDIRGTHPFARPWSARPLPADARGTGMWEFVWKGEAYARTEPRSVIETAALIATERNALTYEEAGA